MQSLSVIKHNNPKFVFPKHAANVTLTCSVPGNDANKAVIHRHQKHLMKKLSDQMKVIQGVALNT